MVALADLALLDLTVQRHVTVLAAGRVLIVGDVHGCSAELEELLRRHHRSGDTVILAGDVVSKGPDSVAALRRARTLDGCYALLGNHEIAALRGRAERGGGATPSAAPKYAWTDGLDASDVAWMRRLPFSIALPAHGALVVHAGLVPGVALDAQQPIDLVTMRNLAETVDGGGGGPRFRACEKAELGATAWAAEWRGPRHVYFGHDARRGLQRTAHATGLDTGCVYGGALTCAILEIGQPVEIVSVAAEKEYVPKLRSTGSVASARGPAGLALALRAAPLAHPALIALSVLLAFVAAARWLRA